MFRKSNTRSTPPAPPVRSRAAAPATGQRELRSILRDLANEGRSAEADDRVSVIDLREAVDAAADSVRR